MEILISVTFGLSGRISSVFNSVPRDPPVYPGTVDRRTSGIIFLGRTERYLIEISMSESKQTKSAKRGRGRPRLFDRTAAIQQAMVLFWDRGYEGTTFDDLIKAMKLSPSSFYHEFGSKEQLYREAVDYDLKLSTSSLRGFSSHRDTRAAFEALIEEAAAFFTNDGSPAGCMISLAGTHLPPHLRSVADYTKSLRKLFEQGLARRLRKGVSDGDLPREQTLKNSLPTSAPFFAGWLSRRVTAYRANNFWRSAEWQCELGPSRPPDTNRKNGSGESQPVEMSD